MTERAAGRRDRLASALAAGALQAALLYLLVAGLAVTWSPPSAESPTILALAPPIAAPEPRHQSLTRATMKRPEGASAPPNRLSHATEVTAPPPIVFIPTPSPVVAAPVAGQAFDPSAGAAAQPGPGTGAGGSGAGAGGGRYGDGDGGGGSGEGGLPPRRLRGRIRNSDYPAAAGVAGVSGTVTVRYAVGADGKASDCRIEQSSGSGELDQATCRLIERRFRFAPARDEAGRPVRSILIENHSWFSLAPEPR